MTFLPAPIRLMPHSLLHIRWLCAHAIPIVMLLLTAVLMTSCASRGQQQATAMVSAELRALLADNQDLEDVFNRAIDRSLGVRRYRIAYFDDPSGSRPNASHWYARGNGTSEVVISIKNGQHAIDQLITIIFEAMNSTHESEFMHVMEQARQGTISRSSFPIAIIEIEYKAVIQTKAILSDLPVDDHIAKASYYYGKFMRTPDHLSASEYVQYAQKDWAAGKSPIDRYHTMYDRLRSGRADVTREF